MICCLFVDNDPLTFEEAMEEKRRRRDIKKNDIQELSKLRKGHDAIGVKSVFRFKKKIAMKKDVELVHVKTQNQVANIFTKTLMFEDFRRQRTRLGVQKIN